MIKAEAHHRFNIGWKKQVVDALESSKELIAYGGSTEIEAHQRRQREGWLEAVVDADRWHLLGFERTNYDIELKVYQAPGWTEIDRSEPGHHPKLEASFAGVDSGKLPHVTDWDETMDVLRSVVSSHLEWAGVGRDELVADDYQPGPAAPTYQYPHPVGRRDQLVERYKNVATEVYREALKAQTQSVYDILKVVATETGATYDVLEERTGLARSTIRYHVRRLQEAGVVDRIGSPVLVVFPAPKVLRDAQEVLNKVYPGDSFDDMNDRAEERREERKNRDDPGQSIDDQDGDDGADDDRDDGDSQRGTWRYFSDLDIEPHQLGNGLERDYIDEREVRVRIDRHDWLG